MRILFMGTPDIAAASLEALYAAGHEICGVFTREDKPVGRKHVLMAPPVKEVALAHDTPVYQPKTLRSDSVVQDIRALNPELIVVVAYGRILPKEVLQIPPKGCINLHVSLLPQYRGAAPIQWSVLNGDTQTGVTIMQLDEGLDTGDILKVEPVQIDPEETSGELFEKVTRVGANTLLACLEDIAAGRVEPIAQDHDKATLAPPLTKEMAQFCFDQDAEHVHNWVRGMNPWPMAYFICQDKKVKVLESRVAQGCGVPGTVLSTKPLTIACKTGAIQLLTVVPEGKKSMDGASWAAGRRLKAGDCL